MKNPKIIVFLMALLALSFVLAGCPKGDKMMGGQDRPAVSEQAA